MFVSQEHLCVGQSQLNTPAEEFNDSILKTHGISLCDRSERDAHIRFRLPNGTVLGRPPALTVGYDHLSVHVFKRAKSDIAVLQQFSDRND